MISPTNIIAHEWIGLHITIIKAADPRQQGLDGVVRDETMNTFTLETRGKLLQIQKQGTIFSANLPDDKVEVDASQTRFRPEDRVKKGLRKW
jgi:ribonuclease P protein subunit POP4